MVETRTALVTGANRGLGLETCRQLARAGFDVILTSRDERGGQGEAQALSKEGLAVVFRRLDVGSRENIATLVADLRGEARSIDVLVNNAAVEFDGFNADVARETIAINFFGAMNVTDGLLPLIPDGGTIVMVSSGAGELSGFSRTIRDRLTDKDLTRERLVALMQGFVDDVAAGRHAANGWPSSAYRVSKGGLNALTRLLAEELAGRRIRVNAVCPGWVRTRMGGASAPRGVEKGAASIVFAALLADGTTGGFFRDGKAIPW